MNLKHLKKIFKSDILFIFLLFIFSCFYFARLFLPDLSVFITPDVLLSDIINMNFSLKSILSQSLKNGEFPYWSWMIGNGFPLIGESQIGAFYIPNIIIFKYFPFPVSFNLGYIFSFFICSIGAYLFLNRFTKNKFLSFLSALLLSYSSKMFIQIIHYNLLQAYSLIPIIFYFTERFYFEKKENVKKVFFLALLFILSQQFFTGYVFVSFITFLTTYLYLMFRGVNKLNLKSFKNNVFYATKIILLLFIITCILSIVQLIPITEYTLNSVRDRGSGLLAVSNSLNPKMIFTYFNFNHFGSFPNNTSVNHINGVVLSLNLFWESILFFGLFPFALTIFGLIKFKKNRYIKFAIFIYFISFLLALGKNSPLSFVYGIPPFSFFRTPIRFTIMMNFFIIFVFLLTADIIIKKTKRLKSLANIIKILIYVFTLFSICRLVNLSFSYHPTIKASKLLNNKVSSYLLKDPEISDNLNSIYSYGTNVIWYQTMLNKNWENKDVYLFLLNDLRSYYNVVFNISSSSIFYVSYFSPKKQYYIDKKIRNSLREELLKNDIPLTIYKEKDYAGFLKKAYLIPIEFSDLSYKLLQLKGVKYFITPFNFMETSKIKKVHTIKEKIDNNTYYFRIYRINHTYPKAFVTSKYFYTDPISDVDKIIEKYPDMQFIFGNENIDLQKSKSEIKYTSKLIKQTSRKIKFYIESDSPGLLSTTLSNYPGMKAYVDNNESKIYEVNYNQIAVKIPKGKHNVDIEYSPVWLPYSLYISLFSNILLILAIIFFLRKKSN